MMILCACLCGMPVSSALVLVCLTRTIGIGGIIVVSLRSEHDIRENVFEFGEGSLKLRPFGVQERSFDVLCFIV